MMFMTVGARGQSDASCSDLMGSGATLLQSIVHTPDDGALCVGRILSGGGGYDLLLVRTDATGDTLWTRVFTGPGTTEQGIRVVLRDDSTAFICGGTNAVSDDEDPIDLWVLAVDLDGDLLWHTVVRNTGNDLGRALVPTPDGGCLVTGVMASTDDEHLALVKLDAGGDLVWSRRLVSGSRGGDIIALQDGGYGVVGTVWGGSSGLDQLVMRLDANGDVRWQRILFGAHAEQGNSIVEEPGGTLLIGGNTYIMNGDPMDVSLTRLDSTGAFLWGTSVDNPDGDVLMDLLLRADGTCMGLAYSYSYGPMGALLLTVTDTVVSGDMIVAPSAQLFLYGMDNTVDGGLWGCGYIAGPNTGRLMRLDPALDPCPDCATRTPVTTSGTALSLSIDTFIFQPAGYDTTFALTVSSLDTWTPLCISTSAQTFPASEPTASWIAWGSGDLLIAPPGSTATPYKWSVLDLAGRCVATGNAPGDGPRIATGFGQPGMHLLLIERADGARHMQSFFLP